MGLVVSTEIGENNDNKENRDNQEKRLSLGAKIVTFLSFFVEDFVILSTSF